MNWKNLKVGETVKYSWNEFDGHGSINGIVSAVYDDHAIVEADGMKLWLDDDNAEMFKVIES